MRQLIKGGRIVNEGRIFEGDIVIEGEDIVDIIERRASGSGSQKSVDLQCPTLDATGCYVLPGVIDSHVHFREPGLTEKADMESESRAAAAGGVTTIFDMPNTVPQTITLEALDEKYRIAAGKCHVNHAFFFGATNDNVDLFGRLDPHRTPGIKLFMGSSTGNMLVDRDEALDRIFSSAGRLPVMAHCEDTAVINRNMTLAKQGSDDPEVSLHSLIRSEEACMASTQKAIALATKHGARLHVAHVTTADELDLFQPSAYDERRSAFNVDITAEVTVGHLCFSTSDYARLGTRIKVNPAVKSPVDQFMLRQALTDGHITTIATDHAPHLLSQKEGGCARAASGMPMVQFALPTMLELTDQKVLTLQRMVELMAHNPARLFEVSRRGFLRPGYKADIVVVRPRSEWTVTPQLIESRCGWSPMEGHRYQWRVELTFCNGQLLYSHGQVDRQIVGQPVVFR